MCLGAEIYRADAVVDPRLMIPKEFTHCANPESASSADVSKLFCTQPSTERSLQMIFLHICI